MYAFPISPVTILDLVVTPNGAPHTRQCAVAEQCARAPEQAREDTSPRKIDVTSNPPVGGISVVTLIRTDTTLDHSQKAEKV